MRVAFAGKGGTGKSVIAGTAARLLARRGERVLAMDSDLMPGLALSLGADPPHPPPLVQAAERGDDGRWRYRHGIGPVRAVQRFSVPAPDGVRLLQCGKYDVEDLPPIAASVHAYRRMCDELRDVRALAHWSIVGDLPAGPRQVAYGWANYAETVAVVCTPSMPAMMTARTTARMGAERGMAVVLVVTRPRAPDDVERVEDFLGLRALAVVPDDPAVQDAERLGRALIDHAPGAPAVRAIERLVDALDCGSLAA